MPTRTSRTIPPPTRASGDRRRRRAWSLTGIRYVSEVTVSPSGSSYWKSIDTGYCFFERAGARADTEDEGLRLARFQRLDVLLVVVGRDGRVGEQLRGDVGQLLAGGVGQLEFDSGTAARREVRVDDVHLELVARAGDVLSDGERIAGALVALVVLELGDERELARAAPGSVAYLDVEVELR